MKCRKAEGNAIPVVTYCRHNANRGELRRESVSLSQ